LTSESLRDLGRKQIVDLCGALSLSDQTARTLALFDVAAESWGQRASDRPWCRSDITDDSSPFEFSVAFDGDRPELRLLLEAQGEPAGARAHWGAAWRLSEELEKRFGASLDRARRVADLFEPSDDDLAFSLWHASSCKSTPPAFKVYFNPAAQGAPHAMPRIREALSRLGMTDSWEWLRDRPFTAHDRLLYLSLDLSADAAARTKIYVGHAGATASAVERFIEGTPGHQPGEAERFCQSMTLSDGPYTRRPPITCMAFRQGAPEPYTVTLHMPIRCYAPHDGVALERISSVLSSADAALYERAVRALSRRPLDAAAGIQTYVSVRRERGRPRVTIYLSPEAYCAAEPPASSPKASE
jgi:DMATS type aromatic prenyltransferase